MIETLGDYINYYHKYGKCIDQISPPKNNLSERQLENKFNKYIIKMENRKHFKKDDRWVEVKKIVFDRDKGECQLLEKLPQSEIQTIIENSYGVYRIIDPAHILNKSTHPNLYYDPDNIICLNRFSHSNLDFLHSPLNGERINKEEEKEWWMFIVGEERYNRLKEKAENSKRH